MLTLRANNSFDGIAEGYDLMDSIHNNNGFFIENMPGKRNRALDIGCGSGIVAEALSPYFLEVIGVDISEDMIELARRKRNGAGRTYIVANAEEADFAAYPFKGGFDYIVSRTTFHHIENIPVLLEKMKSALNPGGIIAIIDCVNDVPTPSVLSHIPGAFLSFGPDVFRNGFDVAWRIMKFRLSRGWLAHLASDVYLSEKAFDDLYGNCLPDAEIIGLRYFRALVWRNT